MKRLFARILGVFLVAAAGSAMASEFTVHHPKHHLKKEIHKDQKNIHQDKKDIAKDKTQENKDQAAAKAELAAGHDKAAIKDEKAAIAEKKDIHKDEKDIHADKKDIRKDRKKLHKLNQGTGGKTAQDNWQASGTSGAPANPALNPQPLPPRKVPVNGASTGAPEDGRGPKVDSVQ